MTVARAATEPGSANCFASMRDFGPGKPDTLSGFGIAYHQSSRWQRIASIPETPFEHCIATTQGAEQGQSSQTESTRVPVEGCDLPTNATAVGVRVCE